MTNLCLENYGVSNLETQEMKTTNGGNLWHGAIGRMVAMRNFAIGLIEGFTECNCD